ncbi:MAG: DUF4129 domain-containing protein [Acidimicrobiales bacterium]
MWIGGDAPPRRVERIVASVTALGVLLVVAAVASAARRGSSGGEVHPLGLRVVGDIVLGLVGAVALLAVVLLVDLVVSLRRRRAAATDQVLGAAPRSWWERLLLSMLGLVVLVGGLLLARGLYDREDQLDRQGTRPWPPGRPGSRAVSEAQVDWPVVGAVMLVVVGALVAVAVAGQRRRLTASGALPQRAATARAATDDAALGAVEAAGLDELRREPDPRRAVIRAYGAMDATLASWGLPRRPWETPFEFLERTLVGLGASAGVARRLTVLFEQARFSRHAVTEASKAEAIDAVGRLRGEAAG